AVRSTALAQVANRRRPRGRPVKMEVLEYSNAGRRRRSQYHTSGGTSSPRSRNSGWAKPNIREDHPEAKRKTPVTIARRANPEQAPGRLFSGRAKFMPQRVPRPQGAPSTRQQIPSPEESLGFLRTRTHVNNCYTKPGQLAM